MHTGRGSARRWQRTADRHPVKTMGLYRHRLFIFIGTVLFIGAVLTHGACARSTVAWAVPDHVLRDAELHAPIR
jgi:hypothetical protein